MMLRHTKPIRRRVLARRASNGAVIHSAVMRSRPRRFVSATCFLSAALTAFSSFGQTSLGTSSLAGTVTDGSGLVIDGAQVDVTDSARGTERHAVTNKSGNYVITALPASHYTMRVEKPGFNAFNYADFAIEVNQRATVDVSLKPGDLQQSVTVDVRGEAPMLETDNNALGSVIENRRVEELPLNGRNFLQLAILSGGVETPPGGSAADRAAGQTGHSGRTINIGGNPESVTTYLIDGIVTRGSRLGESSLNVSVADIDQFKLQMNFFMPDQGPNPGIVNVVTKAGTNRFHGELFEFVRNGALDARNFFSPTAEQLQRNQFGFAAGGPVLIPRLFNGKNRLWFHAHYEGTRQIQKFSSRAYTPTQAMFGGDFSAVPQQIYNPFSFDAATGLRAAFMGNQIPASLINPVSKALLPYYYPGRDVNLRPSNYFGQPRTTTTDDQFSIRGDYNPNSNHSILLNTIRETSPVIAGGLFPLQGVSYPLNAWLGVAQDTFIISPSLVNILRIGYSRSSEFSTGQGEQGGDLLTGVGITGTLNTHGIPGISIQGYTGFGRSSGPLGDVDNNYQLDEALSWNRGNHSFQFGAGARYHRTLQQNSNANALGSLSFQTVFTAQLAKSGTGLAPLANTGNAFADFLLGIPTTGQVVGLEPFHYRYTEFFPYVQDSWKIRRGLTINWGLSWYHATVPNPQGADANIPHSFDFKTGLLTYAALKQVSPQVVKPDYKDWAPRLGVAWQPSFLKNTVVRAGAGIYYETGALIETQFDMVAPPFQPSLSISNSQFTPQPTYLLGKNTFPVIALAPLSNNFAASLPQGFTPFAISENSKLPYISQWNVSVQHTLRPNDLVQVDYTGTSGHRQQNRYDVDQCRVSPAGFCDPATRPYPRYNYILLSDTNGNLNYEAMILRYQHQFSKGLTFVANYTYSKVITDGWEGGGSTQSQIASCRACDRGPTSYNNPRHFVVSAIYELPFGRGRMFGSSWNRMTDLLVGGWAVNAIATFSTGTTFTVSAPNRTGSNFTSVRANRSCDGNSDALSTNVRNNGLVWFDRSCFSAPAPGYFGNSGRGILLGPGTDNWDIGVQKNFRFTESSRFELRAEAFNELNHAQFNIPSATVGDANFGVLSSARAPRLMQLAGRLIW